MRKPGLLGNVRANAARPGRVVPSNLWGHAAASTRSSLRSCCLTAHETGEHGTWRNVSSFERKTFRVEVDQSPSHVPRHWSTAAGAAARGRRERKTALQNIELLFFLLRVLSGIFGGGCDRSGRPLALLEETDGCPLARSSQKELGIRPAEAPMNWLSCRTPISPRLCAPSRSSTARCTWQRSVLDVHSLLPDASQACGRR